MQKAILLLAIFAFAGIVSASRFNVLSSLWQSWKQKHNKLYSVQEDEARHAIFVENYKRIAKLNKEYGTARFAVNKFADLTPSEFRSKHANGAFVERDQKLIASKTRKTTPRSLPDSVDWRNKGAVTPVKDQGQCGSCWAFSVTGTLEGHYFINNGQLLSFSEQQIVDCDTAENQGCNGGWPYLAVQYAAENGIEQEDDYPYTAQDGFCEYDSGKSVQVATGYEFITPNSTDHLKDAIVNNPVSVCIEADEDVFQFYSDGVITIGCGAYINHAVLAVGYQKLGLLEAFTVKNSWGTNWGDSGYVFISTIQELNDGQGACGILYQPVVAV